MADKKEKGPSDTAPIGANADGSVNVVPPEQIAERLAEIAARRKDEGFANPEAEGDVDELAEEYAKRLEQPDLSDIPEAGEDWFKKAKLK